MKGNKQMKIQINSEDMSGCNGYTVWNLDNNTLIENHTRNINKRYWDDADIEALLNEKQYNQFENGKYVFTVTKKDIFKISQNNLYFDPNWGNAPTR